MTLSSEQLVKMDTVFKVETFTGNQGDFHLIKGNSPVLVSAPHSVTQFRNGKPKTGEFRTGVIAQLLQEKTGCYSLFKTKNMQDDANFDSFSPYREFAKRLVEDEKIEYVLDLHIMAPTRPYDIDLGTGRGKNIKGKIAQVKQIEKIFQLNGVKEVRIDHLFTAGYPYTVSADLAKSCNIFCLQIEMNWQLLEEIQSFTTIVSSLVKVIDLMKKGAKE